MKKRFVLTMISLICVVGIALPAALPVSASDDRTTQEVQEEIDAKKQHLDELAAQIDASKDDKAAADTAVKEYQQNYDTLVELIDEQEASLKDTEKQLDNKTKELSDTMESLKENREKYKDRLISIYKVNNTNVLAQIFTVSSFTEFFQMTDALRRVSENDTNLLKSLDEEKDVYEKQKANIEETISKLNEQMGTLQENRDWAQAKVGEMQMLSSKADEEIQATEAESAATEEEIATLTADLNRIFAEAEAKAAAAAAAAAAAEAEAAANNPDPGTQDPGQPAQPPVDNGANTGGGGNGSMIWPVPSSRNITSYYGDGRANTGSHFGIDIGAAAGAPIVAAAAGTVITAEFHYSYGNYIILDHGNDLRTLYAHSSALYVGVGQQVAAGSTIAAIGTTGDSTGNHLHFEVHANGGRQNPLGGYLTY